MRLTDLAVLHVYELNVVPVEGPASDKLLHRVSEFLQGNASEFSEFELAEFRDADRRVMLLVQESC